VTREVQVTSNSSDQNQHDKSENDHDNAP
jgi:hypothetical protein